MKHVLKSQTDFMHVYIPEKPAHKNCENIFLHPWHIHILTHWGQAMHICVGKLTIMGSDNGLPPGRRQAIIWTYAGILLIKPWGTNFSAICIRNQIFSFNEMHLKMSSAKWRLVYLGLNVLIRVLQDYWQHGCYSFRYKNHHGFLNYLILWHVYNFQ